MLHHGRQSGLRHGKVNLLAITCGKSTPLMKAALLLAISGIPGCQPNFVLYSVTDIEVTDVSTGEPVEGASILATWLLRFDEEEFAEAQPTDADGRTFLRLLRIGDRPFYGVLTVTVTSGEDSETLKVTNKAGESATGSIFEIKIVATYSIDGK